MDAPRWLLAAAEMMNANPVEMTVAGVANAVHIHAAHFTRQFRRYFGCTPGDYLRRLRLKCALELLSHAELTLAEIAVRCGFCDQSHFTRVLKRQTGLTPATARHRSLTRV